MDLNSLNLFKFINLTYLKKINFLISKFDFIRSIILYFLMIFQLIIVLLNHSFFAKIFFILIQSFFIVIFFMDIYSIE